MISSNLFSMIAVRKDLDTVWEESRLIQRAQAGCAESFNVLVSRYYQAVYHLAYRLLGQREEAADATQSTFLKAYRSLKDFDVRRALKPWLFKICVNVCIDMQRARSLSPCSLSDLEGTLPAGEESAPQVEREELRREVRSAIARLPIRYRQVVILRHYYGLEVAEIAEVVGAPSGTVKSWLYRARALLRKRLKDVVETGKSTLPYRVAVSASV
jgi:RNA polymerase sigma-70 factor (ECF subfamily)